MVVTNLTNYNLFRTTLFNNKKSKLYEIVNKHILKEKIEGDSNIALDLIVHFGVVHYIAIFEHLYTTTELTETEIKTLLNYDSLRDAFYPKGYDLKTLIEQIIDINS